MTGEKINVDVKKVVPFMTWKGDPIILFCVGESITKVNLRKQTHNISTSNDIRNKCTVVHTDNSCFCWKVRLNINLIIKSPYSFTNLVLSIFEMQSKFVLINQSLIYYALIWSFHSVDLRRYKKESKAILHILCFAHWSWPNYFCHTWHINFWKPFQCKVFPCTLKNHCIIVIYYLGYWNFFTYVSL